MSQGGTRDETRNGEKKIPGPFHSVYCVRVRIPRVFYTSSSSALLVTRAGAFGFRFSGKNLYIAPLESTYES